MFCLPGVFVTAFFVPPWTQLSSNVQFWVVLKEILKKRPFPNNEKRVENNEAQWEDRKKTMHAKIRHPNTILVIRFPLLDELLMRSRCVLHVIVFGLVGSWQDCCNDWVKWPPEIFHYGKNCRKYAQSEMLLLLVIILQRCKWKVNTSW